jgi:hypothetical protein
MRFTPIRGLLATTATAAALILTGCNNTENPATPATSSATPAVTPATPAPQGATQTPTGALGEFRAAIRDLYNELNPICGGTSAETTETALAPSRELLDAFREGLKQTPFAEPFDEAIAQAQANRPIADCAAPTAAISDAQLRTATAERTAKTQQAIQALRDRMEATRDQAMEEAAAQE